MRAVYVVFPIVLAAFLIWQKPWQSEPEAAVVAPQEKAPATEEPDNIEKAPIETVESQPPAVREYGVYEVLEDAPMVLVDLKRKGRFVMGKVLDTNGNVVPRCHIKARSNDGSPPHTAMGRADGAFHIMLPKGKPYTLVVTSSGLEPLEVPVPEDL